MTNREEYDYPLSVKIKRFFTGAPDYFRYIKEEILNINVNTSGFDNFSLKAIPISDNLKAPAVKAKTYANRIRKNTNG